MSDQKTIHLTDSEIANAETSYGETRKYTIIRRLQHDGKYLIAAIDLEDRHIIDSEFADTKEQVPAAVKEVNRWMDKCYGGGPMSHVSRHRRKRRKE